MFYTPYKQTNNIKKCENFLLDLKKNGSKIRSIKSIMIYGSYARGTYKETSDIDVRIVPKNNLYDILLVTLFIKKQRIIAFFKKIPLDIFLSKTDKHLNLNIENPLVLFSRNEY